MTYETLKITYRPKIIPADKTSIKRPLADNVSARKLTKLEFEDLIVRTYGR